MSSAFWFDANFVGLICRNYNSFSLLIVLAGHTLWQANGLTNIITSSVWQCEFCFRSALFQGSCFQWWYILVTDIGKFKIEVQFLTQ